MKKPLLIYGGGGLGREILAMVRPMDAWEIKGFVDDGHAAGTLINGVEVIGGLSALNSLTNSTDVVLAFGDPMVKSSIAAKIKNSRVNFPTIIHPSVMLLDKERIRIGAGTIVCAGSILTTAIDIGTHTLINLNCTIGHDVVIGDFVSVMPGVNLAGAVHIGSRVLIGSGANVKNQIAVEDDSRVGMGAVVIQNVQAGTTVVGVPAKPR